MLSFPELGWERVIKAIEALGFQQPTPIQEQAIPSFADHSDFIGLAQTGTENGSFLVYHW